VDAAKLIEIFKQLGLELKKRDVYERDKDFFAEFD
jgi:hypothetical protein